MGNKWRLIEGLLGTQRAQGGGRALLVWNHMLTHQISGGRYRARVEDIKPTHRDLADYFLSIPAMAAGTTIMLPTAGCEREVGVVEVPIRPVCQQPLLYSETKYNMRRLYELWYHLLQAGE